jgi:hypothetical protein
MESAGGRRRKGESVNDRRDPQVSDSGGRRGRCGTRARARGDGLSGRDLGSAQEEDADAGGNGLPAELGQKQEERKFSFSFSFSIISKHFQMILESNLNLNQTTHLKNSNATA